MQGNKFEDNVNKQLEELALRPTEGVWNRVEVTMTIQKTGDASFSPYAKLLPPGSIRLRLDEGPVPPGVYSHRLQIYGLA